jgi:hypothetical protein
MSVTIKTPMSISRTICLYAAAVSLTFSQASQVLANGEIPARIPFDHYAAMMNRSPFAVATAAVAAAAPSFAKDLYVANAYRTTEGDFVTVQSSVDRNLKEYLSTKGPNEHGYAISNIEWSDVPGRTKVTISKDGQFASVAFNQALMATALPGPPAAAPFGIVPPQPAQMPSYLPKAASVPGVPTPPPAHVRGMIPRNPSVPNPRPPLPDTVDQ